MASAYASATPDTVRAWQALRRSRTRWQALAALGWVVQAGFWLLFGDAPTVLAKGDLGLREDLHTSIYHGERGSPRLRADVVVRKLRGLPAEREHEATSKLVVRMRGPATTMAGKLYVSRGDLVWIPDGVWRAIGAQDLLLKNGAGSAELVPFGRRTGLTALASDGSQVWLWLRRRVSTLSEWHAN